MSPTYWGLDFTMVYRFAFIIFLAEGDSFIIFRTSYFYSKQTCNLSGLLTAPSSVIINCNYNIAPIFSGHLSHLATFVETWYLLWIIDIKAKEIFFIASFVWGKKWLFNLVIEIWMNKILEIRISECGQKWQNYSYSIGFSIQDIRLQSSLNQLCLSSLC